MKVHFVCTGNAYRSRLAEAYLKSKNIPGLEVSSSGIQAESEYINNGPISWYAMRLLHENSLIPFMSKMSVQTTQAMLQDTDLIVFMKQEHLFFAKELLGFNKDTYEVWNVADLDELPNYLRFSELEKITATEATFEAIKAKVDDLASRIKKSIISGELAGR